jgi:hypothetical protein
VLWMPKMQVGTAIGAIAVSTCIETIMPRST